MQFFIETGEKQSKFLKNLGIGSDFFGKTGEKRKIFGKIGKKRLFFEKSLAARGKRAYNDNVLRFRGRTGFDRASEALVARRG